MTSKNIESNEKPKKARPKDRPSAEIEPCPFCRSECRLYVEERDGWISSYQVQCLSGCWYHGPRIAPRYTKRGRSHPRSAEKEAIRLHDLMSRIVGQQTLLENPA